MPIPAGQSAKASITDLRLERVDFRASRPWPVWLGVAVVATIAAVGAWRVASRAPKLVTMIVVQPLAAGTTGASFAASGVVTARRRATVSSQITGTITRVFVEEGMAVAKGAILAKLDDAAARADLAYAQSELDGARAGVAELEVRERNAAAAAHRNSVLARQGFASQADRDASDADVQAISAQIGVARQNAVTAEREVERREVALAQTIIRAPFAGIVVSKDAQPGETISPISSAGGFTRSGICSIVDTASLEIAVDVGEANVSQVHPHQRAWVILAAHPEQRIAAHVIGGVPIVDRQKGTEEVWVALDKRPRGLLPDMSARVEFTSSDRAPAAAAALPIRIPRRAVRSENGGASVWLVVDGKANRRPIRIGRGSADSVDVISGLTSGDHLVVSQIGALREGERVQEAER